MGFDRETIVETGLATSNAGAVAPGFVCRVVGGPAADQRIAVGSRPVCIGAGSDADVIIDDPKMSRRHAELVAEEQWLMVRDLGSTNGTFIESVRISDGRAEAGGTVKLGNTVLKVGEPNVPVPPPSRRDRFGALAGDSRSMRELFAVLELTAPTDVTLLIRGESGTGKELAARAVHDHSERASGPFVVVDCGAVAESLVESELFGHVRGAFTGAVGDRDGAFVLANGGTIFLDEIGELPLTLQPKLLRALEARTVRPVGAGEPVSVDVRVVAATHRDLHGMALDGSFRLDLFHRLAVVHALIPSLRERPEDIAVLTRAFYDGRGVEPGAIDGPNLEQLKRHRWPGNVRELRNVLERAWVLSGAQYTPFEDLDIYLEQAQVRAEDVVDAHLPFKEAKEQCVRAFERRYLQQLIERQPKNLTRAAEKAGINRRHLRRLLELHGLRPK